MGNGWAGEGCGLVFLDIRIHSPLSGWGTVQSYLFRCNVTEHVTMRSSVLEWGTVQSGLFRANNLEFSIGMGNG